MDKLQKMFEKEIMGQFSFPVVATKLAKRQLEKKGVLLTNEQINDLEKRLQNFNNETLSLDFDLNDEQKSILGISSDEKIIINIDSEEELDAIYEEFTKKLNTSLPEIIQEMSEPILSGLRENAPSMLKERRRDLRKCLKS